MIPGSLKARGAVPLGNDEGVRKLEIHGQVVTIMGLLRVTLHACISLRILGTQGETIISTIYHR